jgi:hypothetical protein
VGRAKTDSSATETSLQSRKLRKKVAMRNVLRTFTNQIVAGIRQDRLVVVGTVDVRGDNSLRMRDFYQHAMQASARFLAAIERTLKPATALALTRGHVSSRSQAAPAPRCWQPKQAARHPSARRS